MPSTTRASKPRVLYLRAEVFRRHWFFRYQPVAGLRPRHCGTPRTGCRSPGQKAGAEDQRVVRAEGIGAGFVQVPEVAGVDAAGPKVSPHHFRRWAHGHEVRLLRSTNSRVACDLSHRSSSPCVASYDQRKASDAPAPLLPCRLTDRLELESAGGARLDTGGVAPTEVAADSHVLGRGARPPLRWDRPPRTPCSRCTAPRATDARFRSLDHGVHGPGGADLDAGGVVALLAHHGHRHALTLPRVRLHAGGAGTELRLSCSNEHASSQLRHPVHLSGWIIRTLAMASSCGGSIGCRRHRPAWGRRRLMAADRLPRRMRAGRRERRVDP